MEGVGSGGGQYYIAYEPYLLVTVVVAHITVSTQHNLKREGREEGGVQGSVCCLGAMRHSFMNTAVIRIYHACSRYFSGGVSQLVVD